MGLVTWVFKFSRLFYAQHPVKHIHIVCLKKPQETAYTTQKLQMVQHTLVTFMNLTTVFLHVAALPVGVVYWTSAAQK